MALHPQTVEFLRQLRAWTATGEPEPTIEETRRRLETVLPVRRRELPHVADLTVPGAAGPVPVRLYRPRPLDGAPLPALVYLHGGGWVLGGLESVDVPCRELAARVGCAVVSVDYRLAPEHPFPAAVEDAWAAAAAVAGDPGRFGADPAAVAVAGDSAGGNLAAVVALLARERGVRLAHQLLVYPVTDTARSTPSWREYAEGYGLDAAAMARFMEMYRGSADPADPRLAPLSAADLSGLAPATVITAECDILRDEAEEYARRLTAAGVPVESRRYDGVVHSFFLMPEIFDAGAEAWELAVRRLRAAFRSITGPAREDAA
ncbi:alpha/beta hydrolase [Actinomadura kijaniata]|uniref:Acetyl esterase n=1 Tax=Actinomadura namibiensis TaxID=182080 RepID=A0A7W3LQM1_ACTNM|nr:alpha/beta hydrolase [Actinomadura namibiensis]MBA8952478.1 acetyl esterase [Actinomadura namibiensis]